MSEPATSTEKTAVMSPCPSTPGPARSARDMTICAMEAGKPEGPNGSPAAAASSLCASAKRVMESASTRTWRPVSAKILRHAHHRGRRPRPRQRRPVRGRGDDDAFPQRRLAQRVRDEIPNFASTLADQADDDHVGLHRRGERGKQA